jgi:hypothetical protein
VASIGETAVRTRSFFRSRPAVHLICRPSQRRSAPVPRAAPAARERRRRHPDEASASRLRAVIARPLHDRQLHCITRRDPRLPTGLFSSLTLYGTVFFPTLHGHTNSADPKTLLDAKRHPEILVSTMNVAADPGSLESAGATRRGPIPAAHRFVDSLVDKLLGRLAGVRGGVVVVVLPVVGLLLGLVLITAGCGPPN